jgi:hypothetical protein
LLSESAGSPKPVDRHRAANLPQKTIKAAEINPDQTNTRASVATAIAVAARFGPSNADAA